MTERLFLSLPEDRLPGPETGTPAAALPSLAVPRDLRSFVRQALLYREELPRGCAVSERVLPDGTLRLVLDLSAGGRAEGLLVLGPRTGPSLVRLSGRMEGLSLSLSPAAARAVLGAPVGEVAGRDVPLAAFWGGAATVLADRLRSAAQDADRGEILWAALRGRLSGCDERAPPLLVRAMAPGLGVARDGVRARAAMLGLGERRLQQLCHVHFGLGPRGLLRLHRLHGLLRALRSAGRADWAMLALAHGYCDQAHLVREFRRFIGLTPTRYRPHAVSASSKTGG